MTLRQATPPDIPQIIALESGPIARNFVGQWSEERHRANLAQGDVRYYLSESGDGKILGYAILRGLKEDSGSIELKRIVIGEIEKGLGRRMLLELMSIAFRELKAHRLFLDVYDDNARARHLYESVGFRYEGIMREAASREGRWHDLHLMSMLESEYRDLAAARL